MLVKRECALAIMKCIIHNYLNHSINRNQAVEQLVYSVATDYVVNVDVNSESDSFKIVDCYYAIKHLTHDSYKTTDEEIRYFNECLNGKRIYNVDEKNDMLRDYYAVHHDM